MMISYRIDVFGEERTNLFVWVVVFVTVGPGTMLFCSLQMFRVRSGGNTLLSNGLMISPVSVAFTRIFPNDRCSVYKSDHAYIDRGRDVPRMCVSYA